MTPDLMLDKPDWMNDRATRKLMCLLNQGEGEPQALFVGGCVRNLILQKLVQDIDIATKLSPEKVIDALTGAGVKVTPTGVKHGTVTAVIDGVSFEITTLRRDDETDGRRAKVSFTDDWVEDARRRDFTMNTLLADIEGNIYDPLGSGIADAKAGHVIFVGDAKERIAEDYLRILRFFRFHAYYGIGDMDGCALDACRAAADQISTLSRERITQELFKILSVQNPQDFLKIMFDNKVLSDLPACGYNPEVLAKLCALQVRYDAVNIEARLFVLGGCHPKLFEDYLRFSHTQKNFIIKLQLASSPALYGDEIALKKAIYYHGNALMAQGYMTGVAMGAVTHSAEMMDFAQKWQAPKFPLTGQNLMDEGYVTGPDLGQELKRREEEWLERVIF